MQVVQQLLGYFRGQQDLNQLQQEELPKFSKAASEQAWKQAQAWVSFGSFSTHKVNSSPPYPHPEQQHCTLTTTREEHLVRNILFGPLEHQAGVQHPVLPPDLPACFVRYPLCFPVRKNSQLNPLAPLSFQTSLTPKISTSPKSQIFSFPQGQTHLKSQR